MSSSNTTRMLLSHNFNIGDDRLPALSRSEFCAIFQQALSPDFGCQPVESPHWILEMRVPGTPIEAGRAVAKALAAARSANVEILVLGGIKTTPATSNLPGALQPGEWGVDVVETADGDAFLESIGWAATVASRAIDSYFAVRQIVNT
jgi:Protein of unknown function (DUF2656)